MDIGDKYMNVGIELGLSYRILKDKIDSVATSATSPASQKAMTMLQVWKDSVAEEDLTYSKLASALEKHGLKCCADKYCYETCY